MDDCGCQTGGEPGWSQAWRAPLRAALDRVRDWAVEVFERRGPAVLRDPWAARGRLRRVGAGRHDGEAFAAEHVDPGDEAAVVTASTLLESQRHALLMYTSCGWFFNDLAGIETVQIMRYAACCCDLLAELGEPAPLDAVLATLAEARSNDPAEGDGREIWRRHVDPAGWTRPGRRPPGADRPAGRDAAAEHIAGFELVRELHETVDRGGVAVCAAGWPITHRRTRRRTRWTYAAVHLGGLEVFGAVRPAAEGDRDAATWPPWWATPAGGPGSRACCGWWSTASGPGSSAWRAHCPGWGRTCCGPRPRAWPTGSWPPTTSCARTTTTPWPRWPWRARRWRPSCGARSSWRWPGAWRGRWPPR